MHAAIYSYTRAAQAAPAFCPGRRQHADRRASFTLLDALTDARASWMPTLTHHPCSILENMAAPFTSTTMIQLGHHLYLVLATRSISLSISFTVTFTGARRTLRPGRLDARQGSLDGWARWLRCCCDGADDVVRHSGTAAPAPAANGAQASRPARTHLSQAVLVLQ